MHVQDLLDDKGGSVLSVRPDKTVTIAAAIMAKRRIGALVCRDKWGDVRGIISERDIVRATAEKPEAMTALTVGDMMTHEVRTCAPGDTITDVFNTMSNGHFRHMPVVDGDDLVGLVSATDILRHLATKSNPVDAQRLLIAFVNNIAHPGM